MLEQSKLEIQEKDEQMASQNGGISSPEENPTHSPSGPSTDREIEDVKNNDAEEEADSGVDGEGGHDSPAKEEEVEEPEEDADYELIESVVFKGKMIRRQLSVQS